MISLNLCRETIFRSNLLWWAAAFLFITSCKPDQPKEELGSAKDSLLIKPPEPPKETFYGIEVDSLNVVQRKIRWGQNLADILLPYQVEYATINSLVSEAKEVYDVRKLVAGKDYFLLVTQDSIPKAEYFVHEPNSYEYVVYGLGDSVYAQRQEKQIRLVEKTISGIIQSTMYETMMEQGASPELVDQLVDVFAWQVDFFRIQRGDKFKVIYEEEQVDGEAVGISKIKGAYFDHFDREYYAVHYNQGGGVDFFDEEGNSLRKAFLRAPLNFTRISSRYSGRRYHPVLKRFKAHLGTDYAAPTGTPIRTVGDGVVLEATYHKGNGNYVKIKHNSTYTTQYLHMSKIASGIRKGTRVAQGQTIGYVGSTGLATGPHLCFRFWKNGVQVDALRVDIPPSEPISEKHEPTFLYVRDKIIAQLKEISYPGASSDPQLLASTGPLAGE